MSDVTGRPNAKTSTAQLILDFSRCDKYLQFEILGNYPHLTAMGIFSCRAIGPIADAYMLVTKTDINHQLNREYDR